MPVNMQNIGKNLLNRYSENFNLPHFEYPILELQNGHFYPLINAYHQIQSKYFLKKIGSVTFKSLLNPYFLQRIRNK